MIRKLNVAACICDRFSRVVFNVYMCVFLGWCKWCKIFCFVKTLATHKRNKLNQIRLIAKEIVLRFNYLSPPNVLLAIAITAPGGEMLWIVPQRLFCFERKGYLFGDSKIKKRKSRKSKIQLIPISLWISFCCAYFTWLLMSFSQCAVFSLSPKLLMRIMHPWFQTSASVIFTTLWRRSEVNFNV